MCGITGYFSYKTKINTQKYYQAHLKIAHRGPDDEGFIYQNSKNQIEHLIGDDTIDELKIEKEFIYHKEASSLILGHRRLSIIDLSSHGHQPFSFDNLYLVYNGEIYNYIELRDELKELGYKFETDSDTEVFLKAYHCWGVEAFNKFNGMWASAIYDTRENTLLLTRDRFGIKPLYYSFIDDNLIFGSEIKFVASFMDKLYPNEQMIYEYLRFNYINHTEQTCFKDIFQLEPNSYMYISKTGKSIGNYWTLQAKQSSKERIEEELDKAIKLRMRSDVEVGSLLSGGIDSSTLLGIINDKQYRTKFQTFSAVFKEKDFSEKCYIDKFTTENIKLEKHFIYPKAEKLVSMIDELIYTQEEPFRSLAVFSQYEIYRYIQKNTKTTVLLNGQGADEIFTGYSEHYLIYLLELLRTLKIKVFLKEFNALKKNRNLSTYMLLKQLFINVVSHHFRPIDKYKIFTKKFKYLKRKKFKNLLKNSLYQNLTFSALREYLRYEDKNSMRFSLESRLPFLDVKLVESAFALENNNKIQNGVSKIILREIAKGKIPDETLKRKDKMGFVSPQEIWQRNILKDEMDKIFQSIEKEGIFECIDHKQIFKIYQKYQENHFNDWAFIWRVYLLYKWKKVWKINAN